MRVSVKENQDLLPCKAFLDGTDVSNECFEADEEEGYVVLYKTTENGRKYLDPETDDVAWEREEGHVRIQFPTKTLSPSGKELISYG